jgi:hypothetical protein
VPRNLGSRVQRTAMRSIKLIAAPGDHALLSEPAARHQESSSASHAPVERWRAVRGPFAGSAIDLRFVSLARRVVICRSGFEHSDN